MIKAIGIKGLNGRLDKRTAYYALFLTLLLFLCGALLGCSCHDDPVGPDTSFQLTAIDVGVTEAWLKVTVNAARGTFTLQRNDSTLISNLHSPIDTVIYDEGLLPKHTYTYKAGRSKPIAITTMDTTSHNFTICEVTTLGDGNYSVLYDVAIVNDTCVYAVGEIYKRDSTGQFETTPYNVARWNNNSWQLMRIPTKNYGGYISNSPVKTVYAFGEHDIWTFSVPGSYSHWNGVEWKTEYVPERSGGGTKLWGTNSSNLFLVGTNGSISYYNGSAWRKIESGTTTHINDAWGVHNPLTGKDEMFCAVTDVFAFKDRKILLITNTEHVDSIPWTPQKEVVSVWTPNSLALFACGDGFFKYCSGVWKQQNIGANIYITRVRGNRLNDIFAVGPYGLIAHNNGQSWKLMTGVETGDYTSIAVKGNLVVAVGASNDKAITVIGKRN